MDKITLNNDLEALNKKQEKFKILNQSIIDAYHKYSNENSVFNTKRIAIQDDLNTILINEINDNISKGIIDWKTLLNANENFTYELLQNALKDSCVMQTGYYPETNQRCITVKISKNETDENLKTTEKTILNYIEEAIPFDLLKINSTITFDYPYSYKYEKSITKIENFNTIKISEKTLSASGIYSLVFSQDKWFVTRSSHNRYEIISKIGNLFETLEYIRENVYSKQY